MLKIDQVSLLLVESLPQRYGKWTVIYSTDPGLADAYYHRTIFVKPVKDLEEILKFIEHKKHQTLGLSIDKFKKKIEFAELAVKNGIECTNRIRQNVSI